MQIVTYAGCGEILLKEVNTLEPQITLLMSHAEDQIMSAELVRVLVEELIEIYTNQKNQKGE